MTGLIGSSVNLTWSFSGDVDKVYLGLKQTGVNDIDNNGRLGSLDKDGILLPVSVPSTYTGRVSGSRRGNVSSGQAVFTLSSITNDDERSYGCVLTPSDPFDFTRFDSVHLVVEGECVIIIIHASQKLILLHPLLSHKPG